MTRLPRRSVRMLFSAIIAMAIAMCGLVAVAGSANAAYAPTGSLSNYNPRRCTSVSVSVANFPKKKTVTATSINKKRYVRLTTFATNSRGSGTGRFRVPCNFTPGYHILGLAAKGAHIYLAFNVRKYRG